MIKPHIPIIEIMVTDACNFVCEGCTNYSDYQVSGLATWPEVKKQLLAWRERTTFGTISLIGGEPLLHPNIREWITGIRELFPESFIQLTTNGYLLHRNIDILDVLDSVNGALLKISAHKPDDTWFTELKNELADKFTWHAVADHPNWLQNENYLYMEYEYTGHFVKSYKGSLATMKPYNSDPYTAFHDTCCQQLCPVLKDGKLYKCSSMSELKRVLTHWDHLEEPEWQKYLAYTGLDITCDDTALWEWADNYGKHAWHCSMCPTMADEPGIAHIGNVKFKKDKKVIPITR